jgi:catechol 2,3-dioxygenase-like lactoylglutathione lyase family enzyme
VPPVLRFHHVQIAVPAGREEDARRFYGEVLGLEEVPKPPALSGRGGCWFRGGEVELHLGVEEGFRPARKAHPAMVVEDLDGLERRLRDAGHDLVRDSELDGYRRFHSSDPFGNRLEFLGSR